MRSNPAPIALFVYNRPWHTRQTIEALQKNKLAQDSELFIFSDGPKNNLAADKVKEIRNYIKIITGFKEVKIIERATNFGLAKSIINGVAEIVNRYGKIIVLEDDLVTSPYFLEYMNDALDMYENEDKVASISGYIYPVRKQLPGTFFLRGADCWGWATWKRGWDLFEPNGTKLLKELKDKKLTKKFDLDNSYPYTQMLKMQTEGLIDSWAIRWHISAFLNNKLTLYPGVSLVKNIGFDASGTHTKRGGGFNAKLSNKPIKVEPTEIEENMYARKVVIDYFQSPRMRLRTLMMCLKYLLNTFLCKK